MQAQTHKLPGFEDLISNATGAPRDLLPILEEIMRDEVFHSTLDWQTRAELQEGAVTALRHYKRHKVFFDADLRLRKASVRLRLAEKSLDTQGRGLDCSCDLVSSQAEVESARFEVAAARVALDKILNV